MSSEVEICNLALAHLGDSATVASIDPPEGSAQAEHCARWYPVARNSLLELQEWHFATTRTLLAELVNPFPQWQHAYARPADCLKLLAILPSDATGDVAQTFPTDCLNPGFAPQVCTIYTPAEFAAEIDATTGNQIILTNQANALVRYTRAVTDTSKFSPLFTDALGWYLAGYLAGPVLKGETGVNVGRAMKAEALAMLSAAAVSSANQGSRQQVHAYPWSR
ncbi:hypothetical protein SAMN05428966_102122 [Massilia sp. PDC64]|nr:hypothetical protein [Massilia sp. PDC64]SDC68991.1 hypothetical protein SAMN05428966_102122 [Massilia sp. PDC64]